MSDGVQKNRIFANAATFIVLEVAAAFIFFSHSDIHKSWIGRGFTNAKAVLWGGMGKVGYYFSLAEVNEHLAQENFTLLCNLANIRDSLSRNAISWAPIRSGFEMMPANIVMMTHGSMHNYLLIDRGGKDGVDPDCGIITANGVVGIVQSVSDNYAYAVSYANKDMKVSARIGREGSIGVLRWDEGERNVSCLEGIPLYAKVEIGDTIYTSGYSAIFPADIPLGVVTKIKKRGGNSFSLNVLLLENFSALHHVIVVRSPNRTQLEGLLNEK